MSVTAVLLTAETIPMASVASIHFFGDIVNAFGSACFLTPSNSRGVKSGLSKLLLFTLADIFLDVFIPLPHYLYHQQYHYTI